MKLLLLLCFLFFFRTLYSQNPEYAILKKEIIRFFSIGQLKEGCLFADSVCTIMKKENGVKDTVYPIILYYSAMINGLLEDYQKCETIIRELEDIAIKEYGEQSFKYYSALNLHYMLHFRKKEYGKSILYLEKSRKILLEYFNNYDKYGAVVTYDVIYNKEDIQFLLLVCCGDLAFANLHTNNYSQAEKHLKEREYYFDEGYTIRNDPQSYVTYMNNYASFLTYIEELDEAEAIYTKLEAWTKKNYNESHPTYGEVLFYQAGFYYTIGDMTKAEKLYMAVKKNLENTFQKNSAYYKSSVISLASIYLDNDNITKLEPLIRLIPKLIPKNDPVSFVEYTQSRTLLTRYYLSQNMFEQADSVIRELDRAYTGKDFSSNYVYSTYLKYKANLYTRSHQYESADSIYSLLLSNAEYTNKIVTKVYCNYLLSRSINCFKWGKQELSEHYIKKSIESVSATLEKNFLFLSETQKQLYLQFSDKHLNELNKLAVDTRDEGLKTLAYDVQLLVKGLLLKTSIVTNRDVKNGDPVYEKLYEEYINTRNAIVFQSSKPEGERYQLEELFQKAELLEKKLTKLSASFVRQQFKPVKSSDISGTLKPNEAAIEFFNFKSADSVFYCAFLVIAGQASPAVIRLFEKNEMDTALGKTKVGNKETNINLRYGKNHQLYDLIWRPLEKYLSNISKVYFTPSGMLHKISMAALSVNDNYRVSDIYQLVQLNTTASVTLSAKQFIGLNDRIDLYGGVLYDGDTTALKQAAVRYHLKDVASRSLPDDIDRGNIYQYLPGSKTEVENIGVLATGKNFKASVYTGWRATEESVKSLSGLNSPAILHIATHGFFFPDPKIKPDKSIATEGRVFRQSDNPLIRSGLTMAGANYTWDNKPIKGIQDGIFTAYEVSNLNLSNTKLAVLSACETGLGDIQGSEGVYGLQRSFKIAGIKNLVMSLWDVPDEETSEFMTEFYKKMFFGESIEEGFYNTQTTMKNKYRNEPYKWAAWILVR